LVSWQARTGGREATKGEEGEVEAHLFGIQLQEDVVTLSNAMLVSPTVLSSSLEVLPVDETAVDVDGRERDGTELLEVEIQEVSVDLVRPYNRKSGRGISS